MTSGAANSAFSLFIDTNVLVYASVASSPFLSRAQKAIQAQKDAGADLWISRQVVREFLVTLSRSSGSPNAQSSAASPSQLKAEAELLLSQYKVAEDNSTVTNNLLQLILQVPMQGALIHDANIVATMLAYGITDLLTHNVADFMRFSGYINVIPLA